jgi:diaminohydroxyphosphoribosylaminopyrimidine deaminase/5-amino-6-(5-phosphoribosylamino)uracil reductase
MRRALDLARSGEGFVEPNPMVGAVVVDENLRLLSEGFHERFGGPHAEVQALAQAAERARGATLYVTLEPCNHHGKTPPCVDAVLKAAVRRVVIGMSDPYPQVAGAGAARLRAAGVEVEVGVMEAEARQLTAPFRKLVETGLPWVHAKWAMTLDGKLASRTGHSQWISNAASRAVAHRLRGRMDAVIVGIGTALTDDPLLTARPPGARIAARVVVDGMARLPLKSQLVQTVRDAPVIVVAGPAAPPDRIATLQAVGVEVLSLGTDDSPPGLAASQSATSNADRPVALRPLLAALGARHFTNVLVEGGSRLLGSFFDAGLIDEAHVFIAAKLVGGTTAPSPIAGTGLERVPELASLVQPTVEILEGDVYIRGVLRAAS